MEALRYIIRHVGEEPTYDTLLAFLEEYKQSHAPNSYNNLIKPLIIYLRDFLGREDIVTELGLKLLPHDKPVQHKIPTLEQLQLAFEAMPTLEAKTLFLFYATTGLRKSEVLELRWDNLVPELRAVLPDHWTKTKRGGVTFYNEEAEAYLRVLREDKGGGNKIFTATSRRVRNWFEVASERAGTKITPQVLRVWFAMEMRARGVADSFIDIFQGRAGKSVLSRYYTDRTALKLLKEVYDRAQLRIGVPPPLSST